MKTLSSDYVYFYRLTAGVHLHSASLGRLARHQWMLLHRCSLFAEQELQQGQAILGFQLHSSHTHLCQWTWRLTEAMGRVLSPSEEACHAGVPYLIFSKSNILFSISPLWKWCQSPTLSPNRRECSASFRQHCKSENYVIHGSLLCLDTFRIFPQRGKFSLGAGREPQPPQYPKHTLLLSLLLGKAQGNSAASITHIYKYDESLNRKLQTVARCLPPTHAHTLLMKCWWSCM